MPQEIKLDHAPVGYAIAPARANEIAQVSYREFTSTEDGQHFIQRLEGIPNTVIDKLPERIAPSTIDNMLAICQHDGRATVYVNELEIQAAIRAARPIQAGENLRKDDIADIESLDIGVQIPDDAGFLLIFSVGWRKGLFYDFGPICPGREVRTYNPSTLFGQIYAHVLFQERFSLTDDEWNQLMEAKWFPFIGLSDNSINGLIGNVRCGWELDERIVDIVSELKGRVPQMLNSWSGNSAFEPHIEILEKAVNHFLNDDPISCAGLLYPRIEGILRTHNNSQGIPISPTQDNLSNLAVDSRSGREKCLLLPLRFSNYLREVYFANFDPSSTEIGVSRNSVGHGVASASAFDQKSAVVAILIVHQLFYFLN